MAADGGLERLVHLRLTKALLQPVFPNQGSGTVEERLEEAAAQVARRTRSLKELEKSIRDEISKDWPRDAANLVPGSYILDEVFKGYGLSYKKEADGAEIAKAMEMEHIDPEIKSILKEALG